MSKDQTKSPEAQPAKPPRVHVIQGVPHPVVRTYYDNRQDAVIDVVDVTVQVPGKFGAPPKPVKIQRHIYCNDEALQKKYKRQVTQIEVTDVE